MAELGDEGASAEWVSERLDELIEALVAGNALVTNWSRQPRRGNFREAPTFETRCEVIASMSYGVVTLDITVAAPLWRERVQEAARRDFLASG